MRYAHGENFVRAAIADAGLTLVQLTPASSRTENRVPVPGLLVVARPMNIALPPELPEAFTRWFAARGWAPRAHQLELLAKARAGRSALLIAPTGAGKTLAGFLPTLVELGAASPQHSVGSPP